MFLSRRSTQEQQVVPSTGARSARRAVVTAIHCSSMTPFRDLDSALFANKRTCCNPPPTIPINTCVRELLLMSLEMKTKSVESREIEYSRAGVTHGACVRSGP